MTRSLLEFRPYLSLFAVGVIVGTAWGQGGPIISPPPDIDLPARYDLGPAQNATVAAGYELFPPQKYNRYPDLLSFGWNNTSGIQLVDRAIPDEILAPLGPEPPPGEDQDPDLEARQDYLRDGHGFGTRKVFKAKVPAQSTVVRARVVLGRPERQLHGQQISTSTDGIDEVLVTTEVHPWNESEDVNYPGGFPAAEGRNGAWTRTLQSKADLEPQDGEGDDLNHGGYRSFWFDVVPTAGDVVEIVFDNDATESPETCVAAIELYDWADAPAHFDFGEAPGLVANTAYTGQLTVPDRDAFLDGVDSLNDGALNDAVASFDAMSDVLGRATGLLWVAGWLGNEQAGDSAASPTGQQLFGADGLEWELIEQAVELLQDPNAPGFPIPALADNPRAVEYLDRALTYQRALQHHRLRAFPSVDFPPGAEAPLPNPWHVENQRLLKNLGIAEALWRDLSAQGLEAHVTGPVAAGLGVDVHPLYLKSALYLGLNWMGRSPINNSGELYAKSFLRQYYDVARDFRTLGLHRDPDDATAGPFQDHAALTIFAHMAHYDGDGGGAPDYDEDSGQNLLQHWKGEDATALFGSSVPPFWWADYADGEDLDCVVTPGLETWDVAQRFYRSNLLGAFAWWDLERLTQGRFGGGGGDDVEFLQQHLYPGLPFRGGEAMIQEAARDVVFTNLEPFEGTGHFIGNEDTATAADTEHTGENTGNPLMVMLQLTPGDPYLLEYAARSTRLLVDPFDDAYGDDGVAWSRTIPEVDIGSSGLDLEAVASRHTDPATVGGTPADLALRHLRSWRLDAEGAQVQDLEQVYEEVTYTSIVTGDTAPNARVLQGTYYLNAYNRNPKSLQLMRQWTEFWWYVAMEHDGLLTDGTQAGQLKPPGVLPAFVDYDPASRQLVYGDPNTVLADRTWYQAPSWYQKGVQEPVQWYEYVDTMNSVSYVYGQFLERATDPDTPPGEAADYLLPIYLCCRYLAQRAWDDEGGGGTPITSLDLSAPYAEGDPGWIADRLEESEDMLFVVLASLPSLHDETTAIEDWMSAAYGETEDATDVLEYAERALGASTSTYLSSVFDPAGIDPGDLVDSSLDDSVWLQSFFPAFTTMVEYTDKVFLFQGSGGSKATQNLFASITGAELDNVPMHWVLWEPEDTGASPDLAVFVESWEDMADLAGAPWRARLTHFEQLPVSGGTERVYTLRMLPRFRPGNYQVVLWDESEWDTGTPRSSTAVDVGLYGATTDLSLPYAAVSTGAPCDNRYVVEITRNSVDTDPPRDVVDVAVGERSIDVDGSTGGWLDVYQTVHNVGNADTGDFDFTTTVEFAKDFAPDGTPLSWDPSPDSPLVETGFSIPVPVFDPTLTGDLDNLAWLDPIVLWYPVGVNAPAGYDPWPEGCLARVTLSVAPYVADDHPENDVAVAVFAWGGPTVGFVRQ